MILPGSLIPSDKYFLKNLTFVVRNPLVWLRHHSSQTLYVARVKIMTSRPVGQEGHCFLAVDIPQSVNYKDCAYSDLLYWEAVAGWQKNEDIYILPL